MSENTLESLAARGEALERRFAEQDAGQSPKKDWRRTVGMFAGSEFIRQLDAECAAAREAHREAARTERPAE